jgi:hypothetical protein
MERNPNVMEVYDDGYDTDATEATIIDRGGDDGYNTDEERRLNEYYDDAPTTPPPTNLNSDLFSPFTPPTRLLTNAQIPGQVYKEVIDQDGTIWIVPFTSDDYRSGEQPFDITGRPISRSELPHIPPLRLFTPFNISNADFYEKEGGASKSKKRIRTKKSLRKRRSSRKRKTNRRRKGHSRRYKK